MEIAFAFWALLYLLVLAGLQGVGGVRDFASSMSFSEPVFVAVVFLISSTRPILEAVEWGLERCSGRSSVVLYFLILSLCPLLGSLLSEPAAMVIGASLLKRNFYTRSQSERFKYGTLAVLFVNVSVGGALTPFAAPPIVMVAQSWGWDLAYMLMSFGPRVVPIVLANAFGVTVLFRRELRRHHHSHSRRPPHSPEWALTLMHALFLMCAILAAHRVAALLVCTGFFLIFLRGTRLRQGALLLRESVLVGLFLGGLVILGTPQRFWVEPLILSLAQDSLFMMASALTAITDNAALTFLGAQVPSLSETSRFALVSGALTGGGLTVIANAPNPAGVSILGSAFPGKTVGSFRLFLAALAPTAIAILFFRIV